MGSKNFSTSQKIFLGLIITIAISALIFFFLVKPQMDKYLELKEEFHAKQDKLTNDEVIASKKDSLKREYYELNNKLPQIIKEKLPSQKEINYINEKIIKLGKESNLELTAKNDSTINKDLYVEIPIQIHFKGTYYNLGKFISNISNLAWIIHVKDINIKPFYANSKYSIEGDLKAFTYLSKTE